MKSKAIKIIFVLIVIVNSYYLFQIYLDITRPIESSDDKLTWGKNISLIEESKLLELYQEKGTPLNRHSLYKRLSTYHAKRNNINKAHEYCLNALSPEITKHYSELAIIPNIPYTDKDCDNFHYLKNYYEFCLLAGIRYNKMEFLNIIIVDNKFFSYANIAYEYKNNKNYLWDSYNELKDREHVNMLLLECTFWSLIHQDRKIEALSICDQLLENGNSSVFLTESFIKALKSSIQHLHPH